MPNSFKQYAEAFVNLKFSSLDKYRSSFSDAWAYTLHRHDVAAVAMTVDSLNRAILRDQLSTVRKTVKISLPINAMLGFTALLVAVYSGHGRVGAAWFCISQIVNLLRYLLCRQPFRDESDRDGVHQGADGWNIRRHLRLHTALALISGLVWAFIPTLCEGYTSPETLFYLIMTCGITAGAVTHGFAYAEIPIAYITPPLLSIIGCLVWAGGFQRYCLAGTVILYLAALVRGSRVGEELVKNESKLKNQATALSLSLAAANLEATNFASQMQERAIRDDLTGLLNRRGFSQAIEMLPSRQGDCCLLLLDLDGFKSVNDAFGHKTGDQVLSEIGSRLRDATNALQVLARVGGDEFAIVYDPTSDRQPAETLAIRLIASLTTPFEQIDAGRVGVCIGVYQGPRSGIDDMLIYAHTALYAAKKEGRNRYRVFDDSLMRQASMRRDVERELGQAISSGALEVWYQPIIRQDTHQLDTFEALLRWIHPVHGVIPPIALVDTAAHVGLSEALLRFILREAAKLIRSLAAAGLGRTKIAINVSPREISQLAVDQIILVEFAGGDLSPSLLEVEITEEMLINFGAIHEKLIRLRNAGVGLAMDDFGTGYSSLGSLQKLPVDRVKIDKSLVSGISDTSPQRSLIDAVLHVSRAFGFEVVVEGVETSDDLAMLLKLGCSLMQGHYFARAMRGSEAIAWATRYDAAAAGSADPGPRLGLGQA